MNHSKVERLTGRGLLAAIACLSFAVWACAKAPSTTLPAPAPMHLSEVQVDTANGGTVVRLVGPVDPVYTAFQQEDPPRVVVDLVGVSAHELPEATAVYDGTVEEIAVTPFSLGTGEERTRVELSLVRPVAYDVVVLENSLEVRIAPETEGAQATAGTETFGFIEGVETSDEVQITETGTEIVWGDPQVSEAVAEITGPPADALLEVSADTEEGATRIQLLADGAIFEADHFVLDGPSRLVVDLPGMVSKSSRGAIAVSGEQVSRVRIGQHADKVRVVLDAAPGFDFGGVQLTPTFDGLQIAFGETLAWAPVETTGYDVADLPDAVVEEIPAEGTSIWEGTDPEGSAFAEIAATETVESFDRYDAEPIDTWTETAQTENAGEPTFEEIVPEAAPVEIVEPAGTTEVYGVQFDDNGDFERVVILTDGVAEYDLSDVSSDTLMVRLKGATIDPDAAVRIAPEPAGSVGLVTAFQQPEMATPEVRVVVRRAPGAKPEVSQQGTMLFLDFPKNAGIAATLPIHQQPPASAAPIQPATPEVASGAAKAMAQATPPAALEPLESVDILSEGGLVNGKVYAGRRISLDFKDVEISDVLRLIAEVSDLNIIAGDEVEGEVTIRLVDVPWDQALDVILLTRGLGFVRVGNVLRIAPSDLLKAEEEARLQERRAKEKLEDLVVKLQPVNYADVGEVSKMITRLLTPRGTVDVDVRTNTLILKDIASVINEATALIKAIDTQTPQVLIEAKIVEANLDFSRELGSSFGFGTQPFVDGFDGEEARRDLGSGRDLVWRGDNQVVSSNPITSIPTGLLDLGAFILDQKFNVDLQLAAAESNGEGKVISSPRVVTLDNRKASIEQGVSIPFQTFENGDAKLEFIDAVLRLEVTPHITADRSIIMDIEVKRNAPDDSVQTPTGSPAIAKNEAQTETLVKDGQTLVIGGIYVVRKADRQSRVPYFHKIPLLGAAFKNSEVRDIRQELLVFVTPRIVVNPELAS